METDEIIVHENRVGSSNHTSFSSVTVTDRTVEFKPFTAMAHGNTYTFTMQVGLVRDAAGNENAGTGATFYTIKNNVQMAPTVSGIVFTSDAAFSVEENELLAGAVEASDPDAEDTAVTYAVTGGADMALFDIAGDTGALFFFFDPDQSTRMAPDYENPDDADADNVYHVTVTATGGTGDRAMTATQEITVTVTDALEPPSAPDAPAVTAVEDNITRLTVAWTAPDNTGRPAIESYDLRYRKGSSGGWTDGPQDRTATVADIDGLETGSEYQVQVRATNDEGDGEWSASGAGIPGAGVTLAVTLSLDLDDRVTVRFGVAQVPEDFGTVRIGLRAETNGVRPTEDFTVTLDAVDRTAVAGGEYEWPSPAYTFRAADFVVEEGRYVLTVSNDLEIVDDQVVERVKFLELKIDGTTLPPYVTASAAVEELVVEIRDDDRASVRFVDIVMNEGEEFEGRLVLDGQVERQRSL